MARILVTGGAGYIGSHTAKALAQAGHEPVVLDSFENGHEWAVQWGPHVKANIADADAVRGALETYQPAGVIHFAAYIEAGESMTDPLRFWENNVARTASFLQTLWDYGNGELPLVFSSTAAVYGMPETEQLSEDAAKQPANPYGQTKLAVERMLADLVSAKGGAVAALRYFNACGADPDSQVGEAHQPESHLIPIMLEVVRGQRDKAFIFGDDYPTADGTCIRDYIHVCDLARAHVMALDWLQSNKGYHAFNVGTGKGASVREVIDAVKRVTGEDFPVEIGARRLGDPPVLVADPSLIKSVIGFEAQWTDLDQIIGSAFAWAQKYFTPAKD